MKKLICITALFIIILAGLTFPVTVYAESPLDEIQNYNLTVNMRPDGTMVIKYDVAWKVLDDSSEGPVEFVYIGIPNSHVDEITALSGNIDTIDYWENDGSYVLIDFNRAYYENEIINFSFIIHQSYMYTLDNANNFCVYTFTPGWFDNIEVKSITILWNKENTLKSDSMGVEGNYLVWKSSLAPGKRLVASVYYKSGVFATDEESQYYEETTGGIPGSYGAADNSDHSMFITVLYPLFILGTLIVSFIWKRLHPGGYNGGFGTGTGGFHSGGCACASSCACACACACAGGGRAGCSVKNLYGSNAQTEKLKDALKK